MTAGAKDVPETTGFGPLSISFDHRVLRPRPWTVAQSEWVAELLQTAPPGPVLELCAGAGQIGLLAILGSDRRLVAVDLDPAACAFARSNAEAAGLGDRVEVREGAIEAAVAPGELFPVVVADPPWVRRDELTADPGDPPLAVDGGVDGLEVAWQCVDVARRHLVVGGSLVLQVGAIDQVDLIRGRLRGQDLEVTEVRWCDRGVLARLDRSG